MQLRMADFVGMGETAREVVRLYDRKRHRDHAYYFGGHDSRMCAQAFHALSLWGQGLLDQAQAMSWRAVEDARELGHAFSLAHALQRAGITMSLLKDVEACRAVAEELYPLAERNKFPWQLADANFLRGWLAAEAGNYDAGIEQMLTGIDQPFFAGFRPIYVPQMAELMLRTGYADRAMTMLERAENEARQQGNLFCVPDVARLRGEALLMRSRENAAAAEKSFRESLAQSTQQSCRPLELRAATSLARLLGATQRRDEARDLLTPIYGAFTEGFARSDLQAAKAVLAELS
jgi:predicted ATPase